MGPERNRRIVAALVISLLFLLSSWIDEYDANESTHASVKESVKDKMAKPSKPSHDEATQKKQRRGIELLFLDETEDSENSKEEEDDDEDSIGESSKSKTNMYTRKNSFHFDLHDCFPKFICQIHAHHISYDLTELEKDIIALFRNHVGLESPGSPVYNYQFAAHMGHLGTGLYPSPCQNLYPTCPLSRLQILEILRHVKNSRKIWKVNIASQVVKVYPIPNVALVYKSIIMSF